MILETIKSISFNISGQSIFESFSVALIVFNFPAKEVINEPMDI